MRKISLQVIFCLLIEIVSQAEYLKIKIFILDRKTECFDVK